VAEVTYREIRELSYMGAQVLHEEAILPVYEQKIPIRIRNTDRPEDPGTMILAERNSQVQSIAGVAGRIGVGLLYLEKSLLRKDPRHRSKALEILANNGVDLEWERSGIDSLFLLVPEKQLEGKLELLRRAIEEELGPDHLEILENMALVAVVGEGLSTRPDIIAAVLQLLSRQDIHVRLIDQGSSKISALFVGHSEDFNRVVTTIHDAID